MCVTNESIEYLLKSTAVVIDNEINKENSGIVKLIKELEESGTIFVKLAEINPEIKSYSNASFIILDWKLSDAENDSRLPEGVEFGSEERRLEQKEVLDFIKELTKNFYIPILIFSTESSDTIKRNLIATGELAHAVETGRIGVFRKSDLVGGKVKEHLTDWLNGNLSAQLYKHFDGIIQETKHKFFNEFDNCNANWPSFVYNTIALDKPVDIDLEFQYFILSAFTNRIESKKFETKYRPDVQLNRQEIIKVYSSIKFLSYSQSQPTGANCGDIYCQINDDGKFSDKFMLNITAPCDMRKEKKLFIFGLAANEGSNPKHIDKICEHTVFQFLNYDRVIFNFDSFDRIVIEDNKLITLSVGENLIKYKRLGKLLHPYITNIQDRFSYYITRRGFTRPPKYNKEP